MKDSTGVWKEDREEIKEMSRQFFQSLYEKEDEVRPHAILELVQKKVNEDMNMDLTKDFSAAEISDALFQIGPLKAPGPDGFPARFYQRNWEILKSDVIEGVLSFFESGQFPEGINDTVIVFIPKGKNH